MTTIKFEVISKQNFKKGTPVRNAEGQTSTTQKSLSRLTLQDKETGSTAQLILDYEQAKDYDTDGEGKKTELTITVP